MSENAEHPASVLESLLDRVRELDEARSAGDIDTNHFLTHYADHVLADISPLVIAMRGEFGTGKSELVSALKELPARSFAAPITVEPEAPPPDEAVRGGCRELIGVLDEVAAAALISRSSLGTPAAAGSGAEPLQPSSRRSSGAVISCSRARVASGQPLMTPELATSR